MPAKVTIPLDEYLALRDAASHATPPPLSQRGSDALAAAVALTVARQNAIRTTASQLAPDVDPVAIAHVLTVILDAVLGASLPDDAAAGLLRDLGAEAVDLRADNR